MPQEKQTTAVQWLMQQMLSNEFHNPYFEEALRLERQQIEDAYTKDRDIIMSQWNEQGKRKWASDYFESTFTQQQ
jgi:hypothetical protein